MKSDAELKALFESRGVDLSKTTVHSCGSGVTSCITSLGWELAGGAKTTMYDGSWSEYVSRKQDLTEIPVDIFCIFAIRAKLTSQISASHERANRSSVTYPYLSHTSKSSSL